MIPSGTILASDERLAVEDTPSGTYVWGWDLENDTGFSTAVEVARFGMERAFFEVETWFEGACRDCLHQSNVGSVVLVTYEQQFLLKSGEFLEAGSLSNGMRVRSVGCSCGYEEVKSVTPISFTESRWIFDVRPAQGSTYAVATEKYAMVLRSGA